MAHLTFVFNRLRARVAVFGFLPLALLSGFSWVYGTAQDIPLISGGVAFQANPATGATTYTPVIAPLVAVPVGQRLFFESRADLQETWSQNAGTPGYTHSHFIGLTYLQGSYLASPHLTITGGTYLLPFGTYNERLSPLWISNIQSGPSSSNIGLLSSGLGTGGMLRGSVISRQKYSISYTGFFSTRSGYKQFNSKRAAGGRLSLYLPEQRLEIGVSYDRMLQGVHENFIGTHVWWEPKDTGLRIRSEYNRGEHAQGYWIEADYRLKQFGGYESFIGRMEPVFRISQTARLDKSTITDGVSLVGTQRADFGLDYNLPHNTRILTSYSRQFAPNGNHNIWQTEIVYRFLSPLWKGKGK
jgi:hypothetical protein